MMNCKKSSITKQETLGSMDGVLNSMVKSSTGGAGGAQYTAAVVAMLKKLLDANLKNDPKMTGSDIRKVAEAYLPTAQAAVDAQARRSQTPTSADAAGKGGTSQTPGAGAPAIGLAPTALDGSDRWGGHFMGNAGTGSPLDPLLPAPGGDGRLPLRRQTSDAGLGLGAGAGLAGASLDGGASVIGSFGVAVPGIEVTPDEIRDYFNGKVPTDNDTFVIAEWIGQGKNPMLMLEELSYAKRLHRDVILPCARYYKAQLFGDPDYPVRLGRVLYGIVSEKVVRENLRGSVTSRHLVGQAVNFTLVNIKDERVVQDIASGAIHVDVGTYAQTSGVHATLPFYVDGQLIQRMLLWTDRGTPGFVGYRFTE